jgi:hypothetical protein
MSLRAKLHRPNSRSGPCGSGSLRYSPERVTGIVVSTTRFTPIVLILVLAGLLSCKSNEKVVAPVKIANQAPKTSIQTVDTYTIGLQPLIGQKDLVDSLEYGRTDPFAPLESANTFKLGKQVAQEIRQLVQSQLESNSDYLITQYGPLADLDGFDYSGFIGSGQRAKALVSYQGNLGEVSAGKAYAKMQEAYLPPGWRVDSLDSKSGALTLKSNKIRVVFYPGYTKEQIEDINNKLASLIPATDEAGQNQ